MNGSHHPHMRARSTAASAPPIWSMSRPMRTFRVEPETVRPCPGCAESVYYGGGGGDGEDHAIRKCATPSRAKTCAHCSAYLSGCSLHHGARGEPDEAGEPGPEATAKEVSIRQRPNRAELESMCEGQEPSLAPGLLSFRALLERQEGPTWRYLPIRTAALLRQSRSVPLLSNGSESRGVLSWNCAARND